MELQYLPIKVSFIYERSLSIYAKGLDKEISSFDNQQLSLSLYSFLDNKNYPHDHQLLKGIADSLSDYGNTLLPFKGKHETLKGLQFMDQIFLGDRRQKSEIVKTLKKYSLYGSMRFIYLSSLYYEKTGINNSYGFQLKKILIFMLEICKSDHLEISKIENPFKKVLQKAKTAFRRGYLNTNEVELNLLGHPFSCDKDHYEKYYENADVREIALMEKEFELLKSFKEPPASAIFDIRKSLPSNILLRIKELSYNSDYNAFFMRDKLGKSQNDLPKGLPKDIALACLLDSADQLRNNFSGNGSDFSYSIRSSIFCLTSAIQHIEMIGSSYPNGWNELALYYFKLGIWIAIYEKVFGLKDFKKNLYEMEADSFYTFDYCLKKSKELFKSTIVLHGCGKEYYDTIQELYYLEDDFNSDVFHFSTTLERYRINRGLINSYLNSIESFKK